MRRAPAVRVAALCAVELMLLVVAFTYSRGGLLALAVALAVGIVCSGERLRSLMWLMLAALATRARRSCSGSQSHALTTAGVSLGHRETAGGELALILAASLLVLVLVAAAAAGGSSRGSRSAPSAGRRSGGCVARARRAGRDRRAGGAVALLARVHGNVLARVEQLHLDQGDQQHEPQPAAVGRFGEPVGVVEGGRRRVQRPAARRLGRGSFGVVHLLYRRDTLTVQQPHSVPLQFLAETGIVGGLLAVGGFALLLASAARRRDAGARGARATAGGRAARRGGRLRDPLPLRLGLGHPGGDAAGVGVPRRPGWRHRRRDPDGARRRRARARRRRALCARLAHAVAVRVRAVGRAPELAASKASPARSSTASSASPSALQNAQSSARLASRPRPALGCRAPRVEATIALHRGRLSRARAYLSQAVGRDPTDAAGLGRARAGRRADAAMCGARASRRGGCSRSTRAGRGCRRCCARACWRRRPAARRPPCRRRRLRNDTLRGVKLLVTGGAGYIGSIVASHLLEAGHEVVVFDNLERDTGRPCPSGARLVVADLLDGMPSTASLREGFDGGAALRGAGARRRVGQPPRALLPDERRRNAQPARGDGRRRASTGWCSPRRAPSTDSPTRSRSPRPRRRGRSTRTARRSSRSTR